MRMSWLGTGIPALSGVGKGLAVASAFGGVGLASAWLEPTQVILLTGLFLAGVWACLRGPNMPADILVALLAGNVILSMGFANVGVRLGNLPLPMTEVLLMPLFAIAALRLRRPMDLGWPGLCLVGLLAVTTMRFIVSYPQWGTLAVRDYTTPLEASLAFVIGFWAIREYGVDQWTRVWLVVLVLTMLYVTLYPIREMLSAAGPTVGLQRPVPLLGLYTGAAPAIGAAFFYFHLRLGRLWTYVLGGWCLLLLAILQERSMYLGVPLGILVVAMASRRIAGSMTVRLATGLAAVVIAILLVGPFIPSGRVGSLDLKFYASHAMTIFGAEGPAAATIDSRSDWRKSTIEHVTARSIYLVTGVGPGPDLLDGFVGLQGQLVRKPHNDFLEMFARYGIFGLVFWMGVIFGSLAAIWSLARRGTMPENEQTFLIWMLAMALVYCLVSTVQPLMAFPYGTIPLFTALGMGYAITRRPAAEAAPEPGSLPTLSPSLAGSR